MGTLNREPHQERSRGSTHLVMSVAALSVPPVGVKGSGDAMRRILTQPRHEHPFALPVFPGSHGLWLVQQRPAPPLGYITTRSVMGRWVFDVYAYCRDDGGRRPWLRTFNTLNAAVA